MSLTEAFLYGLVQGLTEYLPISSSAHLILFPRFLGVEDPGLTFDVFLHAGTLLSTMVYFWKDWKALLLGRNPKLFRLIVLATLPALLAGALLHHWVETILRGTSVLVWTLSLGGLLLFWVDHKKPQTRTLETATWKDALGIGIAQCLALIPGVSRSGATITGGRFLGFDRASAARFSFLISAPITGAAVTFELRNYQDLIHSHVGLFPLIVAGLSAFLSGIVAIGGLLRLVKKFSYLTFALYRIALACVIAIVLL